MSNVISLGLIGLGEGTETKETFQAKLNAADPSQTLYVDIHSEGGGVFDGFAIYDLLKEWSGKTVARIKSAAFSVASYVAMACDEIQIAANGFFMVHNPWAQVEGDENELSKHAELLATMRQSMVQAYAEKTGMGAELINKLMSEETYINAEKAKELGMADSIIEAAKAQPQNRMPAKVFAVLYGSVEPKTEPSKTEDKTMSATVASIRRAFPNAKSDFIVRCMEEEMDDESVAKAHAKAMEDENQELAAKVVAMEEEIEALKAKLAAMEEPEETAMEEEPVAVAKKKPGAAKPVANVATGAQTVSAKERWDEVVEGYKSKGMNGQKAVMKANVTHKAVRLQMLEEVAAG